MIQNTSITVNAVVEDSDDTVLLADVPAECVGVKPEGFSISDENSANWLIKKIVAARQYGERVKLWAAQEIARSERDEERLLFLFGGQLERWARFEIQKLNGRKKSLNLPSGQIGFRHQPLKLTIVNEDALLSWARQYCPQAIKTIEHLQRTPINQHFQCTGEIPSGTEVEPEKEKFYIR